ncbi:MAG: hypothetical protein ACFFCS_11795 [Candidatus Hodarchaeota archaeon]
MILELHWFPGGMLSLSGLGMTAIAVILSARYYIKLKTRANLFFCLAWSVYTCGIMIDSIVILKYGTMSDPSGLLNLFIFYLMMITYNFHMLYLEAISRDSVTPWKLVVMAGLSVGTIVSGHYEMYFRNRIPLASSPYSFYMIYSAILVVYMLFYVNSIRKKAPEYLKKSTNIFLAGVIIGYPFLGIVVFSGLLNILPGLNNFVSGVGTVVITLVYIRTPEIAFILPHKVLRLTVINTDSGIALFNHVWSKRDDLINDSLFSSMLQGIGMILNEAVKQGDVEEIRLKNATLILKRSENVPAACVLVTTKSSKILRDALNGFASKFFKKFEEVIGKTHEVSKFDVADEIIAECFPFIPKHE